MKNKIRKIKWPVEGPPFRWVFCAGERHEIVHRNDKMALLQKGMSKMPANEPGSTRNQYFLWHFTLPARLNVLLFLISLGEVRLQLAIGQVEARLDLLARLASQERVNDGRLVLR